MAELTPEQRQAFDDRLRELGMDPSQVVESLRTGDTPGPTYLSNHPDFESAIEPQPMTVDDVDQLKHLAGIPDEDYDSGTIEPHHDPLEPWPEDKNEHKPEDLSAEENDTIHQALTAHVYGHSDRVSSYTAVLNNHFFPMDAVAWAVLDVTVDPDHPLVLKGNNHAYNFGTVTIKAGGQIIIETEATMTCQSMVLE
jgi:hypothetical protein